MLMNVNKNHLASNKIMLSRCTYIKVMEASANPLPAMAWELVFTLREDIFPANILVS